ncbi:MAG: hypothetical protein KDK06_11315 [Gammaproteobacteria bacterium]|nr:hypothetical protein [Gammaproteobacteria bacterium]
MDGAQLVRIVLATALLGAGSGAFACGEGKHGGKGTGQPAAFREMLEASLADKHGLEFHVRGQVIPGVVTAISDDGAVEVRNQARDRIVIRLDRVDAIGR